MNQTVSLYLDQISQYWAAWMVGMFWQVALLVVCAAVVTWLLRRRSAAWRYCVWSLVLVRLVVPPGLALPSGWGWWLRPSLESQVADLSLDDTPVDKQTRTIPADGQPVVPLDARSSPRIDTPIEQSRHSDAVSGAPTSDGTASNLVTAKNEKDRPADGEQLESDDQVVSDNQASVNGAAASSTARSSLSWSLLLMLAWLGIVVTRLGMLLMAMLQVRVWVARARLIVEPSLNCILAEACLRVGLRRRVELKNSEACTTPLVVGSFRPVILLPSSVLEQLDEEEILAVFVHELNHVRRWDGLVNLLQCILGTLYFFHPLVWWSNRQINRLREDACDEATVTNIESRRPFGMAIVKVAEILGYAAPPLALGMLDGKSPTRQRLDRILDPNLRHQSRIGAWGLVSVVVLGLVVIPGATRPILKPSRELVDANNAAIELPVVEDDQPARDEPRSDLRPIVDQVVAPGEEPSVAIAAPVTNESTAPAEAVALAPRLRYRWKKGDTYAYEVEIKISKGDEIETFTGVPVYHVEEVAPQQTTLVFSGRLDSRRTNETGRVLPPAMHRISPFSPLTALSGSGTAGRHSLAVSRTGEIVEVEGDSHLPYQLGNVSRLIFDRLPEEPCRRWQATDKLTVIVEDGDGFPGGMRFAPRSPFRGSLGSPFNARSSGQRLYFTRVATYSIEQQDGPVIQITSDLDIRSTEQFEDEPQWISAGTAKIAFDAIRGIPITKHIQLTTTSTTGMVINAEMTLRLQSGADND